MLFYRKRNWILIIKAIDISVYVKKKCIELCGTQNQVQGSRSTYVGCFELYGAV